MAKNPNNPSDLHLSLPALRRELEHLELQLRETDARIAARLSWLADRVECAASRTCSGDWRLQSRPTRCLRESRLGA
jgi:hypothetical protein